MSRYSVYRLRPDRRFITGTDDYEKAKDEARSRRTPQGEDGYEVWDNQQHRPVFSVYRGEETEAFNATATETAIKEVVDELMDGWSVDEERARAAVRELVNAGGFGGYDNFFEEVSENTAYQVAERMIEEGRIAPLVEGDG